MTPRPPQCKSHYSYDDSHDYAASELKCCAGCKAVWYCSKRCQREDWRRHIFDCNRPIPTAYYLSRAVFADLIPVHAQTRQDFGFDKAELLGGTAQSYLLGLGIGVIQYMEVPVNEVQKWQAEGRMVEGVKAVFAQIPPRAQGDYFRWFLEHQNILDGSPVDSTQANEFAERMATNAIRGAWVHTGGAPYDAVETIEARISALPDHIRECHHFYRLMEFGHWDRRPGPRDSCWVTFGFVAARHQAEELRIRTAYGELLERCTFNTFCTAYEASTIPDLFRVHVVEMDVSTPTAACFRDVMAGSLCRSKSVWYLKQYIEQLASLTNRSVVTCQSLYSQIKSISTQSRNAACQALDDKRIMSDEQEDKLKGPGPYRAGLNASNHMPCGRLSSRLSVDEDDDGCSQTKHAHYYSNCLDLSCVSTSQ